VIVCSNVEYDILEFYRNKARETRRWRSSRGLTQGILSRTIRDVDKSNNRYFERKARETIEKWRMTHSIFVLPYELAIALDPRGDR